MEKTDKSKKLRGFAAMSPERLQEIARMGGKVSGGNFKNNRALAIEAGRKGGRKSKPRPAGKDGRA